MKMPLQRVLAFGVAACAVAIQMRAQPILSTRELRWFDAAGTNYIGLSGPASGADYTLLLPIAAPTPSSNSLLLVNNAAAPWQLIWQSTSTTPGDVLVIGTTGSPSWDQPFWFLNGNTFGGTPTATGLGLAPAAGTRWIGTNTATDFRIGTNNTIRGILSATTGILSLQNDIFVNSSGNGGVGVRVGRGPGTATTENTVVGDGALSANTSGASNTAMGFNALFSNTTGSFNSAVGAGALRNNTTGSNNTAMGVGALQLNVSGSDNSAFGYQALNRTTGRMNTAIGAYAMMNATAADSNVAIGAEALRALTTGRGNVAVGFQAGLTITTGSRNIFIGPLAGSGVAATTSDVFVLGGANTGGTAYNPLLYGDLQRGRLWVNPQVSPPTTPGAHLHLNNTAAGIRPFAIRASTAQTADLMQAENSLGRVIFSINATGGLDFRPAPVIPPAVAQTREFRLYDLDGDYIGFKAPNSIDLPDARVWTLPGTFGAQGDYLTSNTAGTLQWLSGFIYPPFVYDNASPVGGTESDSTFILGSIPFFPTDPALGLNEAWANTGVGYEVLKNLKTADDNVAVGHRAMYLVTGTIGATAYAASGGSRNVAVGKNALFSADGTVATNANENVAIGTSSMFQAAGVSRSVAIGFESLFSVQLFAHSGNVAVGYRAMRGPASVSSSTTGTGNVAIGDSSMLAITSGANNTAVGAGTMNSASLTTASSNTAIGRYALQNITTGATNVAVGSQALQAVTTGTSNVAIGAQTLQSTTSGANNVAIGALALASVSTGSNNLAIGTNALRFSGAGSAGNTAIGVQSMQGTGAGVSTANSVGIGFQTLANLTGTATTSNVAIGNSALRGFTTTPFFTGTNNVAIGASALVNAKDAAGNVAIGREAMTASRTSANNVAIGNSALSSDTAGAQNIAIGTLALRGATATPFFTGGNNIALGTNTMLNATSASSNVAIGTGTLGTVAASNNNVAVGNNALQSITSGSGQNIALGPATLQSITTGTNNVAIGLNTNQQSQTASQNVAIGTSSMLGSSAFRLTGANNVGVGFATMQNIRSTATSNTAVGSNAMFSILEASGNTAIGTGALIMFTAPAFAASNSRNTAVGDSAMATLTTGIRNVAIGTRAMHNSTTAGDNTAVGDSTLYFQTTASNNVAVGKFAMLGVTGSPLTASNNVAIGNSAMRDIRTTAATNTAVGTSAMQSITTGLSNVALGASAGFNNQTNNNRLYIGNAPTTALIHGDFASGRVLINATGMADNALSAPTINAALDIRVLSAADRGLVIRTAAGATANAFEVQDNGGAIRFAISPSGNLSAINGVSYTWPTALPAAAAAGQLGSGIMEVTSTGAMSWRQFVMVQANGLDFPNTLAQNVSDIDVAVVGAVVGDVVQLGTPAPLANTTYTAWVQVADVVRIRFHNYDAVNAANPAAANFKITVIK